MRWDRAISGTSITPQPSTWTHIVPGTTRPNLTWFRCCYTSLHYSNSSVDTLKHAAGGKRSMRRKPTSRPHKICPLINLQNDTNEQGLRFWTTMKPNTLNIKVPANSLTCAVKHEAGVQKIFAFAENIWWAFHSRKKCINAYTIHLHV